MNHKPTLEIYRDSKREWRWRFIAANGNVLADSGEGYRQRKDATDGWNHTCSGMPVEPAKLSATDPNYMSVKISNGPRRRKAK